MSEEEDVLSETPEFVSLPIGILAELIEKIPNIDDIREPIFMIEVGHTRIQAWSGIKNKELKEILDLFKTLAPHMSLEDEENYNPASSTGRDGYA